VDIDGCGTRNIAYKRKVFHKNKRRLWKPPPNEALYVNSLYMAMILLSSIKFIVKRTLNVKGRVC
jgi:hypothetical protein